MGLQRVGHDWVTEQQNEVTEQQNQGYTLIPLAGLKNTDACVSPGRIWLFGFEYSLDIGIFKVSAGNSVVQPALETLFKVFDTSDQVSVLTRNSYEDFHIPTATCKYRMKKEKCMNKNDEPLKESNKISKGKSQENKN